MNEFFIDQYLAIVEEDEEFAFLSAFLSAVEQARIELDNEFFISMEDLENPYE